VSRGLAAIQQTVAKGNGLSVDAVVAKLKIKLAKAQRNSSA